MDFGIGPDPGEYRMELRGNMIRENGQSEIVVAGTKAFVDTRRNHRVQVDASEPLGSEPARPR